MLAALTPAQWSRPSLCAGWSVQVAAGHIVAGAEQTSAGFAKGMATNLFRFNTMMDRVARQLGALPPSEIVERLRARTSTTNHPPAPVMAMLGEIVVHGEDIRRPLALDSDANPEAVVACLDMFSKTGFPVGAKKRVDGLRLVADDLGWSHGAGPEVSGPGLSLVLAMTGRHVGLDGLVGGGVTSLRSRMPSAA
jgi:uncharacterized protein (TIGR03083 family)